MSFYLLALLLFLTLLRGGFGADTNIVYCQVPISVTKEVSFCDGIYTISVFPNSLGFASFPDSADVTTKIWNSKYISVSVSTKTITTLVHKASGIPTGGLCTAQMIACAPTKRLFTAYVTYYTIYAPTGGLTTAYSGYTVTVSKLATLTNTVTVTTGETTCPAADTTTVTSSVSYAIGSDDQVTVFTSGPEPGTSTYYSCN